MLLGAQHDALKRLGGRQLIVAPRACKLAGEPRVRQLADHERAVAGCTDEHGSSVAPVRVSRARARRSRQGFYGSGVPITTFDPKVSLRTATS